VQQHCHCLVTVSSFSPCPCSSNHPLPTLAATSARTSPPPLLPQPPPCQQMKAPILAKKISAALLPPSTLAPCRGCTDQVAWGRPPAGNESIGNSVMRLMVPGGLRPTTARGPSKGRNAVGSTTHPTITPPPPKKRVPMLAMLLNLNPAAPHIV
jgi:hypothetical protein